MKDFPRREIIIEILNNKYNVKWPNSGQMIDIATTRLRLADGQLISFDANVHDELTRYAIGVVNAVGTFNILIPKLKEHLNVKSLLELDAPQMLVIVDVYYNQYLPWEREWLSILTAPKKALEEIEETVAS